MHTEIILNDLLGFFIFYIHALRQTECSDTIDDTKVGSLCLFALSISNLLFQSSSTHVPDIYMPHSIRPLLPQVAFHQVIQTYRIYLYVMMMEKKYAAALFQSQAVCFFQQTTPR